MKRIVLFALGSIVFTSAVSKSLAAATVSTSANANVSADTVGGPYTSLSGPVVQEGAKGDIHTGTIVLSAPAGFEFNTTANSVTVGSAKTAGAGSDLPVLFTGNVTNIAVTPTTNTITVTVAAADGGGSGVRSKLTWSGIKVRAKSGTLTSGNFTMSTSSTATISGITKGTTSFGTLTEIPGNIASLTAGGYAWTRTAGQNGTLTVTAKDRFGNTATNYNGTIDISSSDPRAALPADYTFTVTDAGVHGFSFPLRTAGYQWITATDTNALYNAGQTNILVKAGVAVKLGFTIQPAGATYHTPFATQPVAVSQDQYGNATTNGLPASIVISVALTAGTGPLTGTTNINIGMSGSKGVATFTNLQINSVGNNDVLTVFAFGYPITNSIAFNVSPATLAISATTADKVYNATTNATVMLSDNRFSGDTLTVNYAGAGFANKNVGNSKVVTVNGLSLSGGSATNYMLASATVTASANITPATLAVSAMGVNKTYDGSVNATVTLSDNRIAGDSLVASYTTAAFANKNVGTGKTVNVSGISVGGADAGNYSFNATTTATANISARALAVSAAGINKGYDGSASATVNLSDDRVSGDILSASYTSASFSDKNVGTGKAVSVSGISISGTDAGNYSANTTASATANITAASVTGSVTADNKTYDGNATAAIASRSLTGAVNGDDVALIGGTATFADKDVGAGKTVTATGLSLSGTDAGNYTLASATASTSADISARSLTVSATGQDKTYDKTTAATVTLSDDRISGDTLTDAYTAAAFGDKNVGTGKAVSVTGISISGADAANYTLAATTASATADISVRTLTVGAAGINKVYDGTASATANLSDDRISGDSLTAGYTSADFADKNVGTGKAVSVSGISINGTDAGNYALAATTASTAADISARSLAVTASGINKIYDGSTNATVTLSDDRIAGDSLTDGYVAAAFDDKNIGVGKTVNVSGISIGGTDAGNYSANTTAGTTADITAASVTGSITADNKTYDGTMAATIASRSLTGAANGDDVALTGGTATFADKDVGTNKTVTATGLSLGGADAGNYTLASSTAATAADISVRSLTVSATGQDKAYDGTTDATVSLSDDRIIGDSLTDSYTGASFADKNVGTDKAVSVSGISVSGADSGNYALSSATASATAAISARALAVSAAGVDKIYDGTTAATVNLSDDRISGDSLSAGYTSASFVDKNVGTGKTVSVSGISISGTDAGNYSANTTASTTADITAAVLTVTANDTNRIYGAANPEFTASYSGFQGADDIGILSGSPALTTTAGASSSVAGGPYPIVATNGTLIAANYDLAFINGQLTITPASTTNVVSVSANPSPTGSNVTLTATLTAIAPGGGTPTGTVQFRVDGVALGAPASMSGGVADLSTASLAHGYHVISADYAGDDNFFGSTNAMESSVLADSAPTAGTCGISTTKNVAATLAAATLAGAGNDPDGDALSVSAVAPASAQGGTVVLTAGQIVYTPATDFAGADSFGYTIADSYGATVSGTVTVNVIGHGSQPVSFVLLATPPNHIEIRFNGTPGAEYWVQATTDFSTWTTIATNVPDTNGLAVFVDSDAPNHPVRFYRAVAP